jgi:hypothetical protein
MIKFLKIFVSGNMFGIFPKKRTIWHYYILELVLAVLVIAALSYLLFI